MARSVKAVAMGTGCTKFSRFVASRVGAKPAVRFVATMEPGLAHSALGWAALGEIAKGSNDKMAQSVAQEMEQLLREAFSPTRLEIVNDSAKHSGHMGDDGSGESHFTILIEAPAFVEKSRLERQRMINGVLGDIPGNRVHALAIRASVPKR